MPPRWAGIDKYTLEKIHVSASANMLGPEFYTKLRARLKDITAHVTRERERERERD
jgi:hypothetical protein